MRYISFLFILISIVPNILFALDNEDEISDTLVLRSGKYLYLRPNFNSVYKIRKIHKDSFVFPVNKKYVPEENGDGNYSFLKVRTVKGDSGYILAASLMRLIDYRLKADSIKHFQSIKQPSLDSMIGKRCLDASHVNNEVELFFPFYYLDKEGNFATISAANIYNLNFRYLLLVSPPESACIVMDIIPVDLSDFPKGTSIDFGNCSRGDELYDTSGIISLLQVDPEKYKPDKLLKPFKSWKADLKTNKINEISVKNINCRQQNPEEMFNGP